MKLFLDARAKAAPIIREMRTAHQMDGDRAFYQKSSGERVQMDYQEIRISDGVPIKNGVGLSPEEFMERAEKLGDQMGSKEMEHFLQVMNEATESVGNVVNAGGLGFTFQTFVEVLEKTDIDFLDSGVPSPRTILASPEMSAQIYRNMQEWEKDEEKNAKLKEIFERKQQIHHEREANRRVVD